MPGNNESIKNFGWDIQRLINGSDLTRERSYEMFREVLLDQQPELQQGAFLAALVAKGETPQEIAGAWQAIDELDTVHTTYKFEEPVVENSGTGMDQIKTFNVSSAAAIVASANGIRMGRHGARALTSMCGTVDLLEAVGIDVECDIFTVERSIEQVQIGLFNGMSAFVHPKALFRILGQIRFGSTLNIAASLANPCRPTYAVRGVYSRDLVPKVCAVMKEIGYKRAMVLHGFDSDKKQGMDELSVLGESIVSEIFPDGSERNFSIIPEDVGLKRRKYEEIAPTANLKDEAVRFIQVLGGKSHQACIDFTCLNAAAILYLVGQTDTIRKGIEICYETIACGSALNKLAEWIAVQNKPDNSGLSRFEEFLSAAKIAKNIDRD